jgi:hypothetical protein
MFFIRVDVDAQCKSKGQTKIKMLSSTLYYLYFIGKKHTTLNSKEPREVYRFTLLQFSFRFTIFFNFPSSQEQLFEFDIE